MTKVYKLKNLDASSKVSKFIKSKTYNELMRLSTQCTRRIESTTNRKRQYRLAILHCYFVQRMSELLN